MYTGMVLNENEQVYHGREGYISSSPLPELAKSPAHFFEKWQNGVEPTPAMDLGTFIHKVLLEQDIEKYVPRPKKEGRLVASNTKDYAAFLEANPGKTPIDPQTYAEASAILNSACANDVYLKAFEASDKEVSFYARHEETGLYLKARPDIISKDLSFIMDVKSTADIASFERQIFSMAYDVRLIHYIQTIKALSGNTIPEVYFFAIESKRPYASKMFMLSPSAIESAVKQWEKWIREIAVCKADNHWPGFSSRVSIVERPAYLEVESVNFDEVG